MMKNMSGTKCNIEEDSLCFNVKVEKQHKGDECYLRILELRV